MHFAAASASVRAAFARSPLVGDAGAGTRPARSTAPRRSVQRGSGQQPWVSMRAGVGDIEVGRAFYGRALVDPMIGWIMVEVASSMSKPADRVFLRDNFVRCSLLLQRWAFVDILYCTRRSVREQGTSSAGCGCGAPRWTISSRANGPSARRRTHAAWRMVFHARLRAVPLQRPDVDRKGRSGSRSLSTARRTSVTARTHPAASVGAAFARASGDWCAYTRRRRSE